MVLERPPILLRAEGIAAAVLAIVLYTEHGASWALFAVLIMVPDVGALGYLISIRVGTASYNAVHTTLLPLLLAAVGVLTDRDALIAVALIWLAHIAVDRALGYGLKFPTGFKDTHPG